MIPTPPSKGGIIITGAAKRVGAAMAVYFAKRNFDIALHYNHSKDDAIALQQKIRKIGVACEIFSCDLSRTSAIAPLLEQIHTTIPHCNILINNASVFERCEFLETDEELFDRHFSINFKAPFFLTQSFAKKFSNNYGACVINIIDTDISQNQISHFAYLLSKKTLADFTIMVARALGKNVRVNAVCPGSIIPSSPDYAGYDEKVKELVPLKLQPSLDELSEAVFWLTQQHSITGQIIYVDGGKHVL